MQAGSFTSKRASLYVITPKGSGVMCQADNRRSSGRSLYRTSPYGNCTGSSMFCGRWLPTVSIIPTVLLLHQTFALLRCYTACDCSGHRLCGTACRSRYRQSDNARVNPAVSVTLLYPKKLWYSDILMSFTGYFCLVCESQALLRT